MSSWAAYSAKTCTWPARRTAVDATPPPSSPAGVAGARGSRGRLCRRRLRLGRLMEPSEDFGRRLQLRLKAGAQAELHGQPRQAAGR
eukprot:760768-Pyramimonas_sp.AAC.1